MKTPIVKFHKNEDKFDKQTYEEVKNIETGKAKRN